MVFVTVVGMSGLEGQRVQALAAGVQPRQVQADGAPSHRRGPAGPVGPAPDLTAMLARLDALGHRALAIDLSLPHDPLSTARVIVPGLCAMGGRIDVARFDRLAPGARGSFPEPY